MRKILPQDVLSTLCDAIDLYEGEILNQSIPGFWYWKVLRLFVPKWYFLLIRNLASSGRCRNGPPTSVRAEIGRFRLPHWDVPPIRTNRGPIDCVTPFFL